MADAKISELVAVTDVQATDEFVLARAGASNKIDASDLATGLGWTYVFKTVDESVDTNTTPQNDDELFFTAAAGGVYEIEGLLIYANAAGTAPDLKTTWGEDTTIRGFVAALGVSNTDSNFTGYAQTNQTATIILGTNSGGENRHATIVGHHVGNGGTFRLLWAQNTSNGTATVVKEGSYLRYRKVYTI